ncbi:MAG: hypothetical protein ACJ76J_03585 [Thermoanaerobaculia bacterium]
MDKANVERIHLLLKRHEQMIEEKRINPEEFLRQNEQFQEAFGRVARSMIIPILEEIKDMLVGKVESASIFHKRTAAGLRVKLDRWEDFERSVLFFGDASTQTVRVTHEGVGFGLQSQKLGLQNVTPALVEEEAMKFLKRLFGQEQLRRPMHTTDAAERRRILGSPSGLRSDYQLVRL